MINIIPKVYAQIDTGGTFFFGKSTINRFATVSDLLTPLIFNAIILAGVIFFIMMAVGGVQYILSAGDGNQEGVEKSKNALTISVLGLMIVFASYFVIRIIEYITGIKILQSGL